VIQQNIVIDQTLELLRAAMPQVDEAALADACARCWRRRSRR
jgi:hypothetical protein